MNFYLLLNTALQKGLLSREQKLKRDLEVYSFYIIPHLGVLASSWPFLEEMAGLKHTIPLGKIWDMTYLHLAG